MKIGGPNLFTDAPVGTATHAGTPTGSASHPVDAELDHGTVSVGTTVTRLAAQLQSLPEIRRNRVDSLRQAIQSGQYEISDQQIASALHDQLFNTGSSRK